MKIGYVVQQLFPLAYGSGVHAFELMRELTKFGHELHVITKGEPSQKQHEVFKKIHIHRILNFFHGPYYLPFNSILLWQFGKRIVQKLDLDILLGHGFESSLFFKNRNKIPFIYKAVGTIGLQKFREHVTWRDNLGKLYFPLLGQLEKTAVQQANAVIAISDAIKRELITTYQVPKEKILRIYNGVNIHRFHPSQQYTKLKSNLGLNSKKIILFAGRMSPIKGPQILIQAIPTIIKRFPESFFLFLGSGPLLQYLKNLARRLRITNNIKFLGFISNLDIPKYFAMADLCVVPSLYEPFGLVALESLASGTPVLSSAQGGLAEIHKFLNDFSTIKPPTPRKIIREVCSLLSSPDKLKKLGQTGRDLILKNFTWKLCAKKTNQFLEKFIEK